MTVNTLTYFTVTGDWYDVENPPLIGSSTQPTFTIISALVTFTPRLPVGFTAYIQDLDLGSGVHADTALAIAPIKARILSGQLETIDSSGAAGIQLLANTAALNLAEQGIPHLIYDVKFSNVIYAENVQTLTPFAFTAPTDSTPICLTDPALTRLEYAGP